MSDRNKDKKLDDLLNSALSQYSAVEPRPGLEARILARLQDSVAESHTPWWRVRWLLAGAAGAAIAAVVLSVLFSRPAQKPSIQVQKQPPAISHPQPDHRLAANPRPLRKERRPHQVRELALSDRPSVFPTPMDLSEQEKLMLAYIAQTPKEEIIAQMRPPNSQEEEEFWKDQQPAVARPQR